MSAIIEQRNGKKVAIVFDREYGEYIVKFHSGGHYLKDADYHADSKEDAKGTADYFLDN